MNSLIIGSNGFIGKNLKLKLEEENINYYEVTKKTKLKKLENYCKKADIIFHVAGQNLSKLKWDFKKNNVLITYKICEILNKFNRKPKLIYLSTIKINEKTNYGNTKKEAEKILKKFSVKNKSQVSILRLPNVYGKWCNPNYNSFISTMLYNIPRSIKFKKINFQNKIKLIHVDDVVSKMIGLIYKNPNKLISIVKPDKILTIRKLYESINKMWFCHKNGYLYEYKSVFDRKLYSTFLTYIPKKNYHRYIKKYEDKRGMFSELLKNKKSGQINVFSINPGETRGKHYHNIKNEKFIILSGSVVFNMKCLNTKEKISKKMSANNISEIVSVPGWIHEIKNIGKKVAIILLWSNEIFDKKNPDTYLKAL